MTRLLALLLLAFSSGALAQYEGPAVEACRALAMRDASRDGNNKPEDIVIDKEGLFIERIEFTGDHHSLAIDLAHVVPRLLAVPCCMVVLHHCHPSGIAQPSEADIVATRAFAGLLRLLGMRLHDHVIAGHGAAFSFRAEGLI